MTGDATTRSLPCSGSRASISSAVAGPCVVKQLVTSRQSDSMLLRPVRMPLPTTCAPVSRSVSTCFTIFITTCSSNRARGQCDSPPARLRGTDQCINLHFDDVALRLHSRHVRAAVTTAQLVRKAMKWRSQRATFSRRLPLASALDESLARSTVAGGRARVHQLLVYRQRGEWSFPDCTLRPLLRELVCSAGRSIGGLRMLVRERATAATWTVTGAVGLRLQP